MDPADVVNSYDEYFSSIRADTPELLDRVYRLRYQVYCSENQWENPAEHVDGREFDNDDARAVHTLLVRRQMGTDLEMGTDLGTVRVILPRLDDMRRVLPIQRLLNSDDLHFFQGVPLNQVAEISRFAISKASRRRPQPEIHGNDGSPDPGDVDAAERRLTPYITFGLFRGVLATCIEHGITHMAAVMKPPLLRMLARFGLDFEPIGGLVEYHGQRQPCLASLTDILDQTRREGCPVWSCATRGLSQQAMLSGFSLG